MKDYLLPEQCAADSLSVAALDMQVGMGNIFPVMINDGFIVEFVNEAQEYQFPGGYIERLLEA